MAEGFTAENAFLIYAKSAEKLFLNIKDFSSAARGIKLLGLTICAQNYRKNFTAVILDARFALIVILVEEDSLALSDNIIVVCLASKSFK